jgi:hypothetical protein
LKDGITQNLYCKEPVPTKSYYCAQFLNDDRVWIGGNSGEIAEIYNLQSKPLSRTLEPSSNRNLYYMSLTDAGTRVACVYSDGIIELRNSTSGKIEKQFSLGKYVQTHSARRQSLLQFTSDDVIHQFLFYPKTLTEEVWECLSDKLFSNDLLFCASSIELPLLAVGSNEGLVYLIDTRDGQVVQKIDACGGKGVSIEGVVFC